MYCIVECENGTFQKQWRMFNHVMRIVPVDIYVYTGIVAVMCYSFSYCFLKTCYFCTYLISQSCEDDIQFTCSCCPVAKHEGTECEEILYNKGTWIIMY